MVQHDTIPYRYRYRVRDGARGNIVIAGELVSDVFEVCEVVDSLDVEDVGEVEGGGNGDGEGRGERRGARIGVGDLGRGFGSMSRGI